MAGGMDAAIRVPTGCEDQTEFRRRQLGSIYRDEFPVDPVPGLAKGDTRTVEIVLGDGTVLIRGTAVVTAERGTPPSDDKMMLALIEITEGERELQREAWGRVSAQHVVPPAAATTSAPDGDAVAADSTPAASATAAPNGARNHVPWMLVVAAVLGAGVLFFAVRGSEPPPPPAETPVVPTVDPRVEALRVKLEQADRRIEEGRIVGPGGDYALDILLEAKKIEPDSAAINNRLFAIADRFQKLADDALGEEALAEAATHLQVVLTADPSRDSARKQLADVEERVRSGGNQPTAPQE